MSLSADDIVKLFEKDVRARKRLAELLVGEPDVRLAIINAVLRDVATKSDIEATKRDIENLRREIRREIEELRKEFRGELKGEIEDLRKKFRGDIEGLRGEINELRKEIVELRERISKLEGQMSLFIKLFIAFNLPILIGIIGILLSRFFSP